MLNFKSKWSSCGALLSLLFIPLLALVWSVGTEWLLWPHLGNLHVDDEVSIQVEDSSHIRLIRRGDTKQRILRVVGETEKDVLRGLGYAHARDRLGQMLLVKSVAMGKLSEWWIDKPETRKMDLIMRESQYQAISQQAVDKLDATTMQLLEYYAQGINTFIGEGRKNLPLEVKLLDVHPDCLEWSPVDSMLSMHIMSVVGLADVHVLVEKFVVEAIHSKHVNIGRLQTIFSPFLDELDDELVGLIRQTKIERSILGQAMEFAGQLLPLADGLGSNAWAVSGKWTKSGKPFLALDPHLETSRLPAIWYQVELMTTSKPKNPGSHQFGITMPGVPFIVMGKGEQVSVGFTYGFGDYYDYYIEEIRDGKYRVDEEETWAPVEQAREILQPKKGESMEMVMFHTSRGILDLDSIIVDDQYRDESNLVRHYLSDGFYLSRANSLTSEQLATGMSTIWKISQSSTALEAAEHAAKICISLNFVIADALGNIVYQQSGAHPKRPDHVSGLIPVKGWESQNHWIGLYPPNELVQTVNPPEGMIVSANNDVNDMHNETSPHRSLNMHMGSYRRDRIIALLQAHEKHDMQSMQAIQVDTAAPEPLRIAVMALAKPELERHVNTSRTVRAMLEWDGRFSADSKGAVVFDRIYRGILDEVYGGVVFGKELWSHLQTNTQLFNLFSGTFDRPIFYSDDEDPLGVFTKESRLELATRIVRSVLSNMDAEPLTTMWGDSKTYYMNHILFEDAFPFSKLGFTYGPVRMDGGLGAVWQGGIKKFNGRTKGVGPSWRFLSDVANLTVASSLPGGPSGNRMDGNLYVSGIQEHLNGEYDYFDVFG